MSVPLFNQLTGLSTDSNQIDRYDRLTIYTFIVRPLPPPPSYNPRRLPPWYNSRDVKKRYI